MKALALLSMAGLPPVLLAGCLTTVKPLAESGVPLDPWNVEFVTPGVTTREEVLLTLGVPEYWVPQDDVLVYQWTWSIDDYSPLVSGMRYESGYFALRFNASNRVVETDLGAYGSPGVEGLEGLEVELGRWLREVRPPW